MTAPIKIRLELSKPEFLLLEGALVDKLIQIQSAIGGEFFKNQILKPKEHKALLLKLRKAEKESRPFRFLEDEVDD